MMRISVLRALSFPAAVALLAFAASGPAHAVANDGQPVRAGVITTLAGGVGGPAPGTSVAVKHPCAVAFGHGTTYFTEAGLVRQLDPGNGLLETVVGPDNTGLDPLPGTSPDLPCGAAVDSAGNLVFADTGNDVVRVAAARNGTFYGVQMRAGHVYVVAGGGSSTGTPARKAALQAPTAVAVDRHGNLLVSSQTSTYVPGEVSVQGTAIVQVVGGATGTFYGQQMVPGGIYTIAARCPTFYCAPGFAGDGGPATAAAFGPSIPQLAVDGSGNVLLVDSGNNRVRVIAASSRTFYGQKMTAGDIYTIVGDGTGGLGDGGRASRATLNAPTGVAVAANGNIAVTDTGDQRVRLVAEKSGRFYGRAMTADDIYTITGNGTGRFAGDKGPADRAEVQSPADAAIDGDGNLVFADAGNNRVRLVAAKTGVFYRQRMTLGHIYTIGGNGSTIYSGNDVPATRAQLDPAGGDGDLARSRSGNVILADTGDNRVRVVAGADGVFYGQKFTAGRIYTVAGNGMNGFSADGTLGTKARVGGPTGVAADAAGNILVSAQGRVQVIAVRSGRFYGRTMTAGRLYTVAGGGGSVRNGVAATKESLAPLGLAVDENGNVLIATAGTVRVVAGKSGRFYGQKMTAGDIYAVAGAPGGTNAVTVDHAGNLVLPDGDADEVLVLPARTGTFYGQHMVAGNTYRVAGVVNKAGFYGEGIPATDAHLDDPIATAVDADGNLLIADAGNDRIRAVAEHTGTYYGRKMIAGDIYTVAGGGNGSDEGPGFAGDGSRAVAATLSGPNGIAPYGTDGGLDILDGGNNRVRIVTG